MRPSDFLTSSSTTISWCSFLITWLNFLSNNSLISLTLSSSFGSSWRGLNKFRLSAMFISGRVVTRNRIQFGSLWKWLEITSSSSLRPWYSLSSTPSITMRIFFLGDAIFNFMRGSSNSNWNRSWTSISLSSTPRFLERVSTRTFL